jgi:hypothetical protein
MPGVTDFVPAAPATLERNVEDAENQAQQQAPAMMDNGSAAAFGAVQTVVADPSAPDADPAFLEEGLAADPAVADSTGALAEGATDAPLDTGPHERNHNQPVQVSCREAGIIRMCIYSWKLQQMNWFRHLWKSFKDQIIRCFRGLRF